MTVRTKALRLITFTIALTTAAAKDKDIDVAIIGLYSGNAPAFEETFDTRLRENVAEMQDLYVVDYLQTQQLRRKIRFDESPAVSRRLVESLKLYCNDTTVFVWGTIKSYAVEGQRRDLVKGFIRGELTVSLTLYSLRYKSYAFSGEITATVDKRKGFIFFGSPSSEIFISALEKKDITDQLLDQAALKSATLIASVIRSERLRAEKAAAASGAAKYEIPSVSDMFNMPSVEGASVNRNRGRAKVAMDSTAGRGAAAGGAKAAEKPVSAAVGSKAATPGDTARKK